MPSVPARAIAPLTWSQSGALTAGLCLSAVVSLQVTEVSGLTSTARRLIHDMSKREFQHKMMLWGIAAVLFVAIILIIYYSAKSRK
jgi:Na+/proline symporter